MKTSHKRVFAILAVGVLTAAHVWAANRTDEDAIAVTRSVIKADRQAVVRQALQLTEAESKDFWPVYEQYRAEMDKVGDRILALVKEYAQLYPEIPEARAKRMLKDLSSLEKQQSTTRESYLKKVGRVLPASKTLRFAQVESRLDLALRLELAAEIPLVPIEGHMTPELGAAAAYEAGVPGGVIVRTVEVNAKVAAIDAATRRVTLVSADGIKKTVKLGPEVINFDQIHPGDRVKVTAAEELVVQMALSGNTADSGDMALVALAPKGAKPGGVVAQTTQVTGTITKLNAAKRTVTLRFEDGSTSTFPVRSDVDLQQRKIGEKVSFRVTEMVAIKVIKP